MHARSALNRGRIYDCGRVPPLPKQKQKQKKDNGSNPNPGCFTLLSFLTGSHTNRRKNAFSESGWRRRIERGQISVEGAIVKDPEHVLSKAKQRIGYHRAPWKEPILRVVVSMIGKGEDDAMDYSSDDDDEAFLKILYVDDHLLVIHKPSGLPTMPSQAYYEYSVLEALRRLYSDGATADEDENKNKASSNPTNVFATARARQLIRNHCSVEPQPVHRLGVGTSGVLVVATSLLGRQRLTDAIRVKSNNIGSSSSSSSSSTGIRKVYRALVHARRCDDRPEQGIASVSMNININELGFPRKRNGPLIPEYFTIDCPIGSVPFPIGGDSIHAACPLDGDSLYGHVHTRHSSLEHTIDEDDSSASRAQPTVSPPLDNDSLESRNGEKRSTTKPALSHVRVLSRKNAKKSTNSCSSGTMEETEMALVEVEIPTGRPHQIRIHMAYAGYPLVGDPLYLPGGIPNTVPRNFESLEKEEEDMDTDIENDNDNDNEKYNADNKSTTAQATLAIKKSIKRVALPRDCGYYLHAHTITLEHPCNDRSPAGNDGDASTVIHSRVSQQSTAMTFTAPPPPILRE